MSECKKCVEKYCADWQDYCECETGMSIQYEGDEELSCGCGFIWSQFEGFMREDVRYCLCCGECLE
jgi:hypothetical protein